MIFTSTMAKRSPTTLAVLQALPFGWLTLNTATKQPTPLLDDIQAISTGGCFTAAIDKTGRLLTWGMNRNGQLGHGHVKFVEAPQVVEPLLQAPAITQVDCGFQHIAALDSEGAVWTWGKAQQGQLGHGFPPDGAPVMVPRQVGDSVLTGAGEIPAFSAVECGFNSTYALTAEGEVWVWGQGASLGLGDGEDVALPSRLRLPGEPRITAISAGQKHVAAITDEGEVWVWGSNKQRQLGEGCANEQLTPSRLEIPGLQGAHATRVVAGFYQTAVFADNGSVHVMGGKEYDLASTILADSSDVIQDFQNSGGIVHDISFGWQHMLMLGTEAVKDE